MTSLQVPPPPATEPRPRPKVSPIGRDSVLALFNPRAGGVSEADRHPLIDRLTQHGFANVECVDVAELGEAAFKSLRKHDAIVVLGGDGTARAAAEFAPENGPPLILLPGGTLNVLPRALYGERAWPEALAAALEQGRIARLTHGTANGEPFFVAAFFGAPTLLARAREAVRQGRLITALKRISFFFERSFSRSLRARSDRGPIRRAEGIGVLCPSFSGGVDDESLEWVRLDARHFLDLARVSLRAIGPQWRADPVVDAGRCRSGDVISLGVIPATLDGEPRSYLRRVRVRYKKKGPRVITVDEDQE